MLAAVLGANAQHRIDRMDRALSHRRSSATEKRCVAYGALFANSVAQVGSWVFGVSGSPRLRNTPLDADRLATLWNEPDESWLREVVGPFALTRFSKDSLDVVRDVAGIYPVYWCRVGHGAAVSLEPKGLLALPELSRRLNRQALVRYMAYSFVPGDETMLDGVFELPPAHRLSLRDGACTIHAYDDLRPARAERSLDEDAASVRRLTEHSIDEQLRGRSTVFLSGGLDSSIIAAELAARSPGTCHAYSIHFGPRYPNELEFAREVARRSRLQHHEVELSPKRFIPKLRRAIWHLDDPIGDPITVPNFLLAERVARDGFDTVFNGEGGDPLFGGPKNLTMMLQHWYGGVARGPEFRERAYLRSYRRAYELIGPLLTPDLTRGFDVDEVLETPLRPFLRDTKEPAFLNRLMRINMTLKGANLILPKVDRMLGAHGLRIASPLF
ncbi:MAG: asparagine synthase-related protein, partial [Myxococcota bacterium]